MGDLVIQEYRGIEGLVYAELIKDTKDEIEYGEVKPLSGVSELNKETSSDSATHYYDNVPAIVIDSTGADEVKMNTSLIPLPTLGEITGQYYDKTTGMMVEGERESKYFAIGYTTETTDGTKMLVWRNKGRFNIPASTHATKDDGTDANGQELTYTGINTIHKFNKTKKTAKAVIVDESLKLVDTATFFDTVQTPDTVTAKTTP